MFHPEHIISHDDRRKFESLMSNRDRIVMVYSRFGASTVMEVIPYTVFIFMEDTNPCIEFPGHGVAIHWHPAHDSDYCVRDKIDTCSKRVRMVASALPVGILANNIRAWVMAHAKQFMTWCALWGLPAVISGDPYVPLPPIDYNSNPVDRMGRSILKYQS